MLQYSEDLKLLLVPRRKILIVEGPFGTSFLDLVARLRYNKSRKRFWLVPFEKTKKSLFGLNQVLLSQFYLGVKLSYRCQLNLSGIGYSVIIDNQGINTFFIFKICLSHEVKVLVPCFLTVTSPKPRVVLITGTDLYYVKNFASFLRKLKLPNPYKEKGFYYSGEVIKLKQGKKT